MINSSSLGRASAVVAAVMLSALPLQAAMASRVPRFPLLRVKDAPASAIALPTPASCGPSARRLRNGKPPAGFPASADQAPLAVTA